MDSMLHPQADSVTVAELIERLSALESRNSLGAALQGGTAVTYDANGRIINLNASSINAGSINASIISVSNINASNISSGTLSADRIGANSIEASKLYVSELSAISANLGTITAGNITGALIKTSPSGQRVELTSNDYIELFNASGQSNGKIYGTSTDLLIEATNAVGVGFVKIIGHDSPVGVGIYGGCVMDALFTESINYGGAYLSMDANLAVSGWGSFGGDVDLNGHILSEIGYLNFNTSNNSSTDGRMWYYNAGGDTRYFRARLVNWNGQFDMTGF